MRFAKGHGTENDFVLVVDPEGQWDLTPALTVRLCDRRAGIGADGVLRVARAAAAGVVGGAEWFMDYRNADGSAAEMCGNGIRVFAVFLARHGLVTEPEFAVATRAGPRRVRLEPDGNVTVDMGPVTVHGHGKAVVGGEVCEGLRISVGNPHLACLVDQPPGSFDLSRAPELDRHQFPDGVNVEVLRVTGPRALSMRVRERGSGETRSCGTGAVAAAAAAAQATGERGAWRVTVPGGQLTVTLGESTAWLTGPAVIVAEGDLTETWLSASRSGG